MISSKIDKVTSLPYSMTNLVFHFSCDCIDLEVYRVLPGSPKVHSTLIPITQRNNRLNIDLFNWRSWWQNLYKITESSYVFQTRNHLFSYQFLNLLLLYDVGIKVLQWVSKDLTGRFQTSVPVPWRRAESTKDMSVEVH